MMDSVFKRLLSAILSLAMVLSMAPVPALAAAPPTVEADTVIYYDNSASGWEQVFVNWANPQTNANVVEEIFDTDADGLYEALVYGKSPSLSFGPSADLTQHPLWLESVTVGTTYSYAPPAVEEPEEEPTTPPAPPAVTEDTTIYYDNSLSCWEQVFVNWANPQTNTNEVKEIFDTDADGLYEALVYGKSPSLSFGPSADLTQHPLWLESVTAGTTYSYTPPAVEEPHEHEHVPTVTAPTCTEQGYTTYKCACGDSFVDDYKDALDHDLGDWITDREATCTAPGSRHKACSRCDYSETETISATGEHTFENGSCTGCGAAYEQITWTLENGVLTISGNGPMEDYAGAAYAPWYSRRAEITSVVIMRGVTSIGKYAFEGFDRLKSVTVSDSVTSIGYAAFIDCFGLTSVTIPDSVNSIGDFAFAYCSGLTTLTIPAGVIGIGSNAFFDCNSIEDVFFGGTAGQWAALSNTPSATFVHYSCTGWETVATEPNCTEAGSTRDVCACGYERNIVETEPAGHKYEDGVCSGCGAVELIASGTCGTNLTWELDTKGVLTVSGKGYILKTNSLAADYEWHPYRDLITSVVLGDGITWIGANAFSGCGNLTSISIPATVTWIYDDAFKGCSSLANVYITDMAAWVKINIKGSSHPFYANSNAHTLYLNGEAVTDLVIPGGSTRITTCAFRYCTGLTSVSIPDSVTSISERAFDHCTGLTDVTMGNGVTYISTYAFQFCTSLKSIDLSSNLSCIYSDAFSNCTSLTSITVPGSLTEIGSGIFWNCKGLTSVTIESGVPYISQYMFYHCDSLTEVIIPDTVTIIEDRAFQFSANLASVTIPSSVTTVESYAFSCPKLNDIFYGGTAEQWAAISDGFSSSSPASMRVHYSCASGEGHWKLKGNAPTCTEGGTTYEACSCGYERDRKTGEATGHKYVDGVCSVCQAAELIASGTCGTNLTWELDTKGVLTISGNGPMEDYAASGAPWYSQRSEITEVVITDGVTSIGAYAFYFCSNINVISIPDGVTSIGAYAFYYCSSLTAISIPDGVTSIGNFAFCSCGFSRITIPASVTSIGPSAFSLCSLLTAITIPEGITRISKYAFENCYGLTAVSIPSSVTSIDNGAFSNCSELTAVFYKGTESQKAGISIGSLNDHLTSTAWHYEVTEETHNGQLCYRCGKCGQLCAPDGSTIFWTFENGVLTVSGSGPMAYYVSAANVPWHPHRAQITDVVIGDSVTSIGRNAFYGCSGMKSITIPDGVTSIGNYAFEDCSGLTSITIPASITGIDFGAFDGCSGITAVFYKGTEAQKANITIGFSNDPFTSTTWHYEVTEEIHDEQVCYRCGKCGLLYAADGGLVPEGPTWTLENGVLTISGEGPMEDYAASGAPWYSQRSEITEVVITDGVTSIGAYAFYFCSNINVISIPDSVTSIGSSAFDNCSDLTDITIPGSVTDIGNYAFYGCFALTDITIPNSVTGIGNAAFRECSSLTDIYITDLAAWLDICSAEGFSHPFGENLLAHTLHLNGEPITDLVIPDGVTTIAEEAFRYCTGLKSVTLPDTVTSIEANAFKGCSGLTSITMGGVSDIEAYAFDGCSELTDVYITDLTAWLDISATGLYAHPFEASTKAHTLYLNGEPITDLVIPDGVTAIGEKMFYYCTGITSVTIPDSVASIGEYTFGNCSGLSSVIIGSGVTNIEDDAFAACTKLFVAFYKGTEAQKSDISIGIFNFDLTYCNWHYEVEEEIWDGQLCYRCGKCGLLFHPDGTEVQEGVTYSLHMTTGVLTISGNGPMKNYTSPSDVPWYNHRTSVTSVVIKNGVTSIGDYAFYGCSNLTGITIPDSVTSIGYESFYGCTGLSGITIGNGVASIGSFAFFNCSGLTSITIPESLTSIDRYAFSGCSELTDVYITDLAAWMSVSFNEYCSIPFEANDKAHRLHLNGEVITDLVIPDGVTAVGYDAFRYCSGITTVTIPETVTSIDAYAFKGCSGLTTITIPGSVSSISLQAFNGCDDIEDVYYGGTADQWAALSNRPEADFVHYSCASGEGHWETVTTEPNCTEAGSTRDVCACGYERNVQTTEPSSHNYVNGVCSVCQTVELIASGNCGTNLTWELDAKGALTIRGQGDMYGESSAASFGWYSHRLSIKTIVITDGVTSISNNAFGNCANLVQITIPNSISKIGNYAFNGCSNLTDVYITDIAAWLKATSPSNSNPFHANSKSHTLYLNGEAATDIEIPSGVTSIPADAFRGCTALTSISIPSSVVALGGYAFYGCSNLTGITIPEGVRDIPEYAFYGCSSLTSINIPKDAIFIGFNAFNECSSLASVTIPESIVTIADNAFDGCDSVEDVFYGGTASQWASLSNTPSATYVHCSCVSGEGHWQTVTTAPTCSEAGSTKDVCACGYEKNVKEAAPATGIHSFKDGTCTGCGIPGGTCGSTLTWMLKDGVLTISGSGDMYRYSYYPAPWYDLREEIREIVLLNGITAIGSGAFEDCSALTSVTIPDSVTEIPDYSFMGCSSLKSITIPGNVTRIGESAFEDCSSLSQVTIPGSVDSIGTFAFENCDSLSSINIPYGVTSIGDYAFTGCASLTNITLPASLTDLGERVFSWCSKLSSITIPDKVTGIGFEAFEGCSSLSSVIIGNSVTCIGDEAFASCSSLTEIIIPDNVVIISGGAFEGCTGLTSVTLGEGITAIGNRAFYNCSRLDEITIPDSVISIGDEAFYGCSAMTSVDLGEGVSSIGHRAFGACSSLTGITIPDSVTSIGNEAFEGCTGMTNVTIGNGLTTISLEAFSDCSSLTGVIIGTNVSAINFQAFSYCSSLSSITIPGSVTKIEGHAFADCNDIEDVFFGGTADQWAALSNRPEADFVHYSCASGEGHWETVTTGPNCTEAGSIRDVCACGYERNIEETGPANGVHSFEDGVCSVCGEPDPSALQAPTVTVSNVASSGKIKLTWEAVPGAAKYNVYRSTSENGTYTLLKSLTGTQLTNTSVTVGTTYYYYVEAVSEAGVKSAQSNTVSRTCDLARPAATVSIVASSGKIKISWDAVSGATKYTLYIYDENGTLLKTSSTTGTSITHSSAVAGTSYTYKVKALCSVSAAASAFSAAKSVTCDLARPTVTVTNVASSGKPKVSWGSVSGATKYTLYIYDASGTLLKTSNTTGTSITHTSAVTGTAYTYKVKALCSVSAATSAFSEAKSVTCDLARPTVTVTNVASSGKPKVSWGSVSGATKYTLYIYDAEGTLLKTSSTTGTSITHSSAVAGASYTYKVKALCGISEATSAFSEAKTRVCDLAQPTATVALNASGKPYLTWNKVSGAAKYTVYIYDADGTLLKTSSTTGTKLTHTSAVAGSTYSYRVVAVSSVSSANSAQSTAVSVVSR